MKHPSLSTVEDQSYTFDKENYLTEQIRYVLQLFKFCDLHIDERKGIFIFNDLAICYWYRYSKRQMWSRHQVLAMIYCQ